MEFKKIQGFEEYVVFVDGRVYSHKSNKFLTPKNAGTGYFMYCLRDIEGNHYLYAHRLVAQTFIPNPENKPTVNHINGDKTDNRVENLEWATYSENHKHAFSTGIRNNNHLLGNDYGKVHKGRIPWNKRVTVEDE